MLGWVNSAIEFMVIGQFGEAIWLQILKESGQTGKWGNTTIYSDGDTVKMVVCASNILGITVDAVLEAFGMFFVTHLKNEGYEELMKKLGSTLEEWLNNLNNMHENIFMGLPEIVPPNFWY